MSRNDKPFYIKAINSIFKFTRLFLPIKDRVLFLGSPRNSTLMENDQLVFDKLKCDKKVIVKKLPHKIKDIIRISYYIQTSKVIVIDDQYRYLMHIPLKDKQRLVQMWHGPGAFKKVALDLPDHSPVEKYYHTQYDAFISSSPHVSKFIESGFGISKDVVKPLGYPRSDILINNVEELKKEAYEKYSDLKDKKVILYFPTYRRYNGELLDYDYEIDWEKMNEFLDENDMVLLVKRHPLLVANDIEAVPANYPNIVDIKEDSYFPLMTISDMLITDYSSVFYDYLFLNKPIVFYCPDAEEYLEKNGFYLDFPQDLPGEYCENFDELLNILKNDKKDIDYSDCRKIYLESCDGNSTDKVVKLIEDYIEN